MDIAPEDSIGHLLHDTETGHLVHSVTSGHLLYKTLFIATTGWLFVSGEPVIPSPRFGSSGTAVFEMKRTDERYVFQFEQPDNGGWYQRALLMKVAGIWTVTIDMYNIVEAEGLPPGEIWFLSTWESSTFYNRYTKKSFDHWGGATDTMTALRIM